MNAPDTARRITDCAPGTVATQQPIKVVLYSHDSMGIGHVRRNLALAHQLVRDLPQLTGRPIAGLIVSGLADATAFNLPRGFDWLFIPSITKGHNGYCARNLAQSMDRVISLRSMIIETTLATFRPDLVIVDRHILGVQKELQEPLRRLKREKPKSRIILGLREILDAPAIAAAEWECLDAREDLETLIDQVWLFGDRAVHDPTTTGEIPRYLCDRLRFTGYLSTGRDLFEHDQRSAGDEPFILTTVGGGADGQELLQRALPMSVPSGHRHIVIAGPQLEDNEFRTLQRLAGPATEVHRSWPGLSRMISRAAAVISMGGYNTCAEILATSTPALIVPREEPRVEQLIRARCLFDATAADYHRIHTLTTDFLSQWAESAVTRRVDRSHIQRDGLARMAEFAAEILANDETLLNDEPLPDGGTDHKSVFTIPVHAGVSA